MRRGRKWGYFGHASVSLHARLQILRGGERRGKVLFRVGKVLKGYGRRDRVPFNLIEQPLAPAGVSKA